MFSNCKMLKSLEIHEDVTGINQADFQNSSSLTSISIPDSVTYISGDAFRESDGIQATFKGETYDHEHRNNLYSTIYKN